MKRILIAALVGVMAFSVVTLGGVNFGAQQSVDVIAGLYPLEAYIGYDFDAPYIDMTALSVAGDITLTRADLWPWGTLSGVTTIDGSLTFSYLDEVDIILSSDARLDFAPLPSGIDLLAWNSGVEVIGHINPVLDISAGFNLAYRLAKKDFTTSFFFGFDAGW